MLLAFQASAFDRSATCPAPQRHVLGRKAGAHDTRNYGVAGVAGFFFASLAFCLASLSAAFSFLRRSLISALVGGAASGLAGLKAGGWSRHGSFLPRGRSTASSAGIRRALRVSGTSRPSAAL